MAPIVTARTMSFTEQSHSLAQQWSIYRNILQRMDPQTNYTQFCPLQCSQFELFYPFIKLRLKLWPSWFSLRKVGSVTADWIFPCNVTLVISSTTVYCKGWCENAVVTLSHTQQLQLYLAPSDCGKLDRSHVWRSHQVVTQYCYLEGKCSIVSSDMLADSCWNIPLIAWYCLSYFSQINTLPTYTIKTRFQFSVSVMKSQRLNLRGTITYNSQCIIIIYLC
jgi:hypothetical protein